MRLFFTLLFLMSLVTGGTLAQPVFLLDSLPEQGVELHKNWKWQLGDNPGWAKPDFDDTHWDTLNPAQDVNLLHKLPQRGIGWLRIHLHVAPEYRGQLVCLSTTQAGASELYLNGIQVAKQGEIGTDKQIRQARFVPVTSLVLGRDSVQVVAVRYAFATDRISAVDRLRQMPFLGVRLYPVEHVNNRIELLKSNYVWEYTLFGIFLVLGVLQFIYFIISPRHLAHLYFGLFLIAQGTTHFFDAFTKDGPPAFFAVTRIILFNDYSAIAFCGAVTFSAIFYLLGVYTYFNQPKRALFFSTVTLTLATLPTYLFSFLDASAPFMWILGFIVPWANILYAGVVAVSQKKTGAKLFSLSHAILLTSFILYTLVVFVPVFRPVLGELGDHLFKISFLVLAFTITLLLSEERANTNRLLRKQLIELETLSQKTLAQEMEKQQLLATQNERLEQQVEVRTAELKASQAQLIQKEKLASLGELTAGIAHEIQNPLNFVNNFSEVSTELIEELKEGPFQHLPDSQKEYAGEILGDLTGNLQKINHHGSRASSIVKGMLEHSRTESGERRPTDLNALADEYLRIAYHGLRAKDKNFTCQLATDFDPESGMVEVTPQEIGRVLLNLFNNAFYAVNERQKQRSDPDYTPKVEVRTQRLANAVEICVSDNGTGIPESAKARIFQPFFTTKPTGEGTGLGLSLSYDIVTKGHGGTLTVTGQPDQGSSFTVKLPFTGQTRISRRENL